MGRQWTYEGEREGEEDMGDGGDITPYSVSQKKTLRREGIIQVHWILQNSQGRWERKYSWLTRMSLIALVTAFYIYIKA